MSTERNRLQKFAPPFTEVLEEVKAGQRGPKFWAYYYPSCMGYCEAFFRDDVLAEEATLPLFEHWSKATQKYDEDTATMWTYFKRVAKNFCINFKRDHSYGPEIIYQGELKMAGEFQDDDEDLQIDDQTLAYTEEYPNDGIDREDPESLMIKEEEAFAVGQRTESVRAMLTAGDKDVFDLLLQEYTYAEVAEALGRTEKGIENSIGRIRAVVSTHV